MREILFRGKRIDDGAWVEGFFVAKVDPLLGIMASFILTQDIDDNGILRSNMTWHKVDPKTVGQYTGLTDKNGTKIFEGDIVKHYCGGINDRLVDIGVVFWDSSRCMFLRTSDDGSSKPQIWSNCRYEVIGNIHDNPELLKEG